LEVVGLSETKAKKIGKIEIPQHGVFDVYSQDGYYYVVINKKKVWLSPDFVVNNLLR